MLDYTLEIGWELTVYFSVERLLLEQGNEVIVIEEGSPLVEEIVRVSVLFIKYFADMSD